MSHETAEAWATILGPEELPGVLWAVTDFERIGVLSRKEATAWREAIRASAAERAEPVAEA